MIFMRSTRNIAIQFWQYLLSGLFVSAAVTISEFLDGIVVSNLLGEEGLAVVNLGLPIVLIINVVCILFGSGPAMIFGNALGQSNRQTAKKIFTYTFTVSMGLILLFSITGLLFYKPISVLLAGSGNPLQPELELFLPYLFLSAPIMLFLTLTCKFAEVDGKPKISAALLLGANVINVIMDWVYIDVVGMGVEGSSLGTLTGYAAATLVMVVLLARKKIALLFTRISFADYKLMLPGLPKGLPSAMAQSLFLIQVLCLNYLAYQSDGTTGVALVSLGLGVNSLFCVVTQGVTGAMPPLLTVLQGAWDFMGQRVVLKRCFFFVVAVSTGMFLLFWFFPNIVLDFYGLGGTMGAAGDTTIRMFSAAMVAAAVTTFIMRYLQILSKIRLAMVISAMRNAVLSIPLIFFFESFYGLSGISYGYFAGNLLTAIFALFQANLIARNSNGALQGPLMLPTKGDANLFESSITFDKALATQLSSQVQKNLLDQGETEKTSLFLSIAVEELALLTIEQQEHPRSEDQIDVFITKTENGLRLSFRSVGKPFDPVSYLQESKNQAEYSNLWMLTTLADSLDYERILLMNHTIFCLKN